jgi:uncharacterized protein YqgQ
MLKITMLNNDSDVEALLEEYADEIGIVDKQIAYFGLAHAFSNNFDRIRSMMSDLEELHEKGLINDRDWRHLQIYIVRSTRLYVHMMPYFKMMDKRVVEEE